MTIKNIIKGIFISTAVFGMIASPTLVNAKHRHYHYRYYHTYRQHRLNIKFIYHHKRNKIRKHISYYRKHQKRAKDKYQYLINANAYSGQLTNNPNAFKNGIDYEGIAGGGDDGIKVRIIGKHNYFGKTFYKIRTSDDLDNNMWVYSGDLSSRKHGKAHPINLDKFTKHIWHKVGAQQEQNAVEQNLIDTNNDRADVGLDPLTESSTLDKLAKLRSRQAVNDFNHYNSNGQKYATLDATSVGLRSNFNPAENLDETDGYSGINAGDNANIAWWTNEAGNTPDDDGGHRQNIENPNNQYIGIGATYDTSSGNWFLAQDFGNNDPHSSEYLGNDNYDTSYNHIPRRRYYHHYQSQSESESQNGTDNYQSQSNSGGYESQSYNDGTQSGSQEQSQSQGQY